MAVKTLSHNIPNITNLLDVKVVEAHNMTVSQATIQCVSTTLTVGDSITFNLGYSGDTAKMFTGYVRHIKKSFPDGTYEIVCEDTMCRAVDYFIASNDPENPYERNNIRTEDLIEELLAMAGITNYGHDVPLDVIWGTGTVPVSFNLTTAANAVEQIARALAWSVYTDRNGKVWLKDRKPYDMGSEAAEFTFNVDSDTVVLSSNYETSAENLRNRVVVYGNGSISASAEVSSPHLPTGFYKTAVIATPIITSESLANQVASLNLTAMNRLTETVSLVIEGNPDVAARKFATVTDSRTGASGKWYIYRAEHSLGSGGFLQNLLLTR